MELEDVTFQFLREITDDFSEVRKLGEGAFGVVYKGVTRNGEEVAVKKLKLCDANLDDKQFQTELDNLKKLQHQNIVRILGYCYEIEKKPFNLPDGSKVYLEETYRALCFEYLDNGSLQKHLSDEFCGLDWHTRFKIIKGTCEGLKYIHEELEAPIYHLDIKPDNILLDKDMVPKIADFGLSRIFGKELTRTTENAYGTLGYQPPEYIDKGEISGKFDIFSLGVVMIRIVSGPMGYPKCLESSDELIDNVQETWRNRLQATCSSDSLIKAYCHQVETCTQIALSCLDEDSHKRPHIVKITEKLNAIETGIDKLPQNEGCMTMQNSKIKMRKEAIATTGLQQNIDFMLGPRSNDLEFASALETSSDVLEELIVGRTEEKGTIVASLLKGMPKRVIILPIHGIGGIGKTTFARLIYNDPEFNCYSQVWVDVSHRFDLNKIRESIISQLFEKEIQANEIKMRDACLRKLLSGKKILIVLDDLWEDNQFQLQKLKDMLYHDDSEIIILVTTRSERVAERICTNLEPYKILPLTDEMCWDIIKQRSGFESRGDKEQLMSVGREIAQKCSGVPLAARSLGFTLLSMNFDEWKRVKDSDIWNETISKDISLPNHVLASLMLSYSYMDLCLKPCFTYCGIFPKGHKIAKNDLIYQWISLDFIKATKLLSSMQLCEKYIVQLLGLSFFQDSMSPKTSEEYNEQGTLFTMHDLVHDLAVSLLGNQILDQSKQGNTKGGSCQYALLTDCSKPLELCLSSRASLKALRFLKCGKMELHGSAFSPARYLCVLDLSECCIQKLSDSIGQLQELRYLNAPWIQDQSIPNCITNLSKLSYLSIRGSSEILALPEKIGEMEGLTYIDLSGCMKIQKLPESFGNLKNLDYLDLSNCSEVSGVSNFLGSLMKLQYLNLSHCRKIGHLPELLGSLRNLQYLNLAHSSYLLYSFDTDDGVDIEFMGKLTKLKYLNLTANDYYTRSLWPRRLPDALASATGLVYLNLSGSYQLHELPGSFGKLCGLVHLDLSNCENIKGVPEALGGLTKLQYLNLSGCSRRQQGSLRGLQEAMENLTVLRYLNLGSCLKTMFGDDPVDEGNSFLALIMTLSSLEHLNLSTNWNLWSFPEAVGNLRKLHTLDLSHCLNLRKLPVSISEISSLKQLNVIGCTHLDQSSLPQLRLIKGSVLLPHFVVLPTDGQTNSNLVLLKNENPETLEISKLENVKYSEEAHRIELKGKQTIERITFEWTKGAKRCVRDIEVLTELVPPVSLKKLQLRGYNSRRFPEWMMNICKYLPNIVRVSIKELPNCKALPPLGQLPNLSELIIEQMDSIRKIDGDLYGGAGAFPKLFSLRIGRMENLEEWNTTYSCGEGRSRVLVFPNLFILSLSCCPKLKLKPCPPRGNYYWGIRNCDDVISAWEARQSSSGSSFVIKGLIVQYCEKPLYEWKLLHKLPAIGSLHIEHYNSGFECSSQDIITRLNSLHSLTLRDCKSIAALPDWFGNLTNLQSLTIEDCPGIITLSESIQKLINLQYLKVSGCPELLEWCKSKENEMKLAHIQTKEYAEVTLYMEDAFAPNKPTECSSQA